MERTLKIKEPILSTLAVTNNNLNCITSDEWELVSSAYTYLKVFDELTTEMSAENDVTISKQNLFFLFLMEHLHKFIFDTNMHRKIISMAVDIKTLNKNFKNLEHTTIQPQANSHYPWSKI